MRAASLAAPMAFVKRQSLHDKESRCLFATNAQGHAEKPLLEKEVIEGCEEHRGDAIR